MGIAANALSIIIGSVFGSTFKRFLKFDNFAILGIGIMIISIVGFFENIFDIREMVLKSNDLIVVVFALIVGTVLGDAMQLEAKISNLSQLSKNGFSEVVDATIFFGVGGMQICGPMMLATVGDSSQLIVKSMIDFPFALMFGISYGKRVLFSALPVAIGQIAIAGITLMSKSFLNPAVIKQMCAMGYIILFFSGFNLICEKKHKINNVNMLIGILVILLYNVFLKQLR